MSAAGLPPKVLPPNVPIGTVGANGNVMSSEPWWLFFLNVSNQALGTGLKIFLNGIQVSNETATAPDVDVVDTFIGAGSSQQIRVTAANNTNGANLKLVGNGSVTPSKTLRAVSGQLQILNDAQSSAIVQIDDSGDGTFLGSLAVENGLAVSGAASTFTSVVTMSGSAVVSTTSNASPALSVQDLFVGAGSNTTLQVSATTNTNGAGIELIGDGITTPNKFIVAHGGELHIVNSAYTTTLFTIRDNGVALVAGQLNALAGLAVTGTTTITGTASATVLQQASVPFQQVPIAISSHAVNYTAAATDSGSLVRMTATATLTLPALASGIAFTVEASGSVVLTIAGSGATIFWYHGQGTNTTGTRTVTGPALVTLISVGSGNWILQGAFGIT